MLKDGPIRLFGRSKMLSALFPIWAARGKLLAAGYKTFRESKERRIV
jgi:hypothetical protein